MEHTKLPTTYQEFIHLSRYARWNEDTGRRETWQETVARYFDFMQEHLKKNNKTDISKIRKLGFKEKITLKNGLKKIIDKING